MYVEDVDSVFNAAFSAGATITMPLMEAFWSDRCGQLVDPFGHRWWLATCIKDLSDEELEKAAKTALGEMSLSVGK